MKFLFFILDAATKDVIAEGTAKIKATPPVIPTMVWISGVCEMNMNMKPAKPEIMKNKCRGSAAFKYSEASLRILSSLNDSGELRSLFVSMS